MIDPGPLPIQGARVLPPRLTFSHPRSHARPVPRSSCSSPPTRTRRSPPRAQLPHRPRGRLGRRVLHPSVPVGHGRPPSWRLQSRHSRPAAASLRRQRASPLGTVTAIEAIVHQDDRRPSNGATGGDRPLLLLDAWSGSPGGAGKAAALVIAIQEFVANGGGRPPAGRRLRSAASPRPSLWLVALRSRSVVDNASDFRNSGPVQHSRVGREAAGARPFGKRGAASRRLSVRSTWLCGAHNSAVRRRSWRHVATATVARRASTVGGGARSPVSPKRDRAETHREGGRRSCASVGRLCVGAWAGGGEAPGWGPFRGSPRFYGMMRPREWLAGCCPARCWAAGRRRSLCVAGSRK